MISKTHRNPPIFDFTPPSGAIVPPTHLKRLKKHAMPSNKSNNHETLTPPYPAKIPDIATNSLKPLKLTGF